MERIFSTIDGFVSVDFVDCGLDHITAAQALFATNPSHYDSAGYLAHIGVELLLKGWLLQVSGQFEGTHSLQSLYADLQVKHGAPKLEQEQLEVLITLDQYEKLRYPSPKQATEVGDEDLAEIVALVGLFCRSMPKEVCEALGQVVPGHKAGRVLMQNEA